MVKCGVKIEMSILYFDWAKPILGPLNILTPLGDRINTLKPIVFIVQ